MTARVLLAAALLALCAAPALGEGPRDDALAALRNAGDVEARRRGARMLAESGTMADLRQAVQQVQQEIQADITHVQGDQPSAFPAAVRPQHKAWTQGHFLLQCYKELAQHHGHMELTRDIMLGRGPAS